MSTETTEAAPACPKCGSEQVARRTPIIEVDYPTLCEFEDGEYRKTIDVVKGQHEPQHGSSWACHECSRQFSKPVPYKDG